MNRKWLSTMAILSHRLYLCMEITSPDIRFIHHPQSWVNFPTLFRGHKRGLKHWECPKHSPQTSDELVALAMYIPQKKLLICQALLSSFWIRPKKKAKFRRKHPSMPLFIPKWQMMMAKRNSGNSPNIISAARPPVDRLAQDAPKSHEAMVKSWSIISSHISSHVTSSCCYYVLYNILYMCRFCEYVTIVYYTISI